MSFLYKFFGIKWFTTWDKNKIIAVFETIASLYVYFGWTFLVYAKPLYFNPFCIAWLLCDDVEKAMTLWNTMVYTRKQLYEMNEGKDILYPQDKLLAIIKKSKGEILNSELLKKALESDVCSKASFYRYLNDLSDRKEIKLVDPKKSMASVKLV